MNEKMVSIKENIISILLNSKTVGAEALDKALEIQRKKQLPLRQVLLEEKLVSESQLIALLSEHLYIPLLRLDKYKFDRKLFDLIPERIAKQYRIIPLSLIGGTLTVALSDPLNIVAIDDLRAVTGYTLNLVLSTEEDISRAINAQYGTKVQETDITSILREDSRKDGEAEEPFSAEDMDLSAGFKQSQKPPIVKVVDFLLSQAIRKRASDIHIEPEHDYLKIRYRIDGALQEIFRIPRVNQNAVIARLKIISNLDITENRVPQDGRFRVRFESREIDFRVSCLPTTYGQKFVLRILDKTSLSIGLDKLGFSFQPLEVFKDTVKKPFGMVLVTGPTGSGKSTTLYSILNQLNTPERNIVTIEDPVEYQVYGISQVQACHDIGLDFSGGLRALLRQSPDIIMIGEIRDSETADIAIKASLTGQLVLSTLHTNDAISTITRIIDMGVEPFLAATSIIMLCAQRLCRRVCPRCRQQVKPDRELLENAGFLEGVSQDELEKATIYSASGCEYCNNSGFYGRIAIAEALIIDDTIREMIIKRSPEDDIRKYAFQQIGMRSLRQDAFLKVREGQTTLEEALRATKEE